MMLNDRKNNHHGIFRCRRVVLIQTQGKRNRSALDHLCGPLSDAWPITTNTTSHHLQGPRIFRCASMIKPFALKRLLRKLRPVLLLAVPPSGAGWRAGPSKRVHWTSPFSIKSQFGVLEYILEKIDMISDYTVIVNTVVSVAL